MSDRDDVAEQQEEEEETPRFFTEPLTPRELEVLTLVSDGLHNREVAARLHISAHTVKFHLAAIFGKLSAASRVEAVRRGLQLGLIQL